MVIYEIKSTCSRLYPLRSWKPPKFFLHLIRTSHFYWYPLFLSFPPCSIKRAWFLFSISASQYGNTAIRSPQSLFFSKLNKAHSFSLFSQDLCFSPLITWYLSEQLAYLMSFFVLCSQKLDGECYMWFNKCQAEGDNHFTINLYTARVHLQLMFNFAVYQVPQILICRAAPQPVRPSPVFPRSPLFPFVLVGSHKPPACLPAHSCRLGSTAWQLCPRAYQLLHLVWCHLPSQRMWTVLPPSRSLIKMSNRTQLVTGN